MRRLRQLLMPGFSALAVLLILMPALTATAAESGDLAALQAKVEGLIDREDIRQVMLTYARTIDARDWDTHRKLFADKVEVEGRWVRTRDDLMRGKIGFFGAIQATQHIGMVIGIEVKGDDAHVVSLLHAQHYQPNDFGEPVQRMVGTYDYWLRRSPQGWQIYKYLHNTSWNEGNYWIYQNAINAAEKASSAPPK